MSLFDNFNEQKELVTSLGAKLVIEVTVDSSTYQFCTLKCHGLIQDERPSNVTRLKTKVSTPKDFKNVELKLVAEKAFNYTTKDKDDE